MTPRRMYTVWRRLVKDPVYGSAIGIFRPVNDEMFIFRLFI